jgi:4a-hydroxytetrahydrobiopterin dehydratase
MSTPPRARPQPLSDDAVAAALTQLDGWQGDTHQLQRRVKAPTFAAGIALVDAVAAVADQRDHHPDIDIRWTSITFTLSTHSAGGVTDLDVAMAGRIDELTAAM